MKSIIIINVLFAILTFFSCKNNNESISGKMEPVYKDMGYDLPDAKLIDAKLSKEIADALIREKWEYEVKQINITSPEWKIHRSVNGTITHRSIDTYVALKNASGVCKRFNLSFKQMYNGSGYGITQVNGVGSVKEIPCKS